MSIVPVNFGNLLNMTILYEAASFLDPRSYAFVLLQRVARDRPEDPYQI